MKTVIAAFVLICFSGIVRADGTGVTCSTWAKQIVAGDKEACSDLCPQAAQFDRFNYRPALSAAFQSKQGLAAFLGYLDKSSIMGSGAEAHACAVRALLEHWGDKVFARQLLSQPVEVREQAIGLVDYTGIQHFEARYPKTYRLAAHE